MPLIMKHSCFWAAAIALAVTAGCVSAPGLKSEAVQASPAQLGLAPVADAASDAAWPAADWWTRYGDGQLSSLIETALSGNPDIKIAAARVRLAQQYEGLAGSSDGPDLSLNAMATREKLSQTYIYPPPLAGSTVTDGRVALDFSYEFDFWGRNRALLISAGKQTAAVRAEQEAAKLVLSIAVARTYFQLQERYEALAITQDMLKQRQAVVQVIELRARNGLDSKAEIDPNAAAAASVRQDIAALEENVAALKHQLAALSGHGPDATAAIVPVQRAAEQSTITGVPLRADLLGRRPDIVAQRLRIEAAQSDVAVAKADFYPNVDLRAFFGVQSILLSKLFDTASKTAGAGPAIHLPIFDAGRLRSALGASYAQMDIAVEQYNQTLIQAVREVADQGTSLAAIDRQLAAAEESLRSLEKAHEVADVRYRKGLANYLAVLGAEGPLLVQRRVISGLRERQREAELGLIKALGGGYAEPASRASKGQEKIVIASVAKQSRRFFAQS